MAGERGPFLPCPLILNVLFAVGIWDSACAAWCDLNKLCVVEDSGRGRAEATSQPMRSVTPTSKTLVMLVGYDQWIRSAAAYSKHITNVQTARFP